MDDNKYKEIEKNIHLRNKILNLGICSTYKGDTGPTGPTGSIGPTGPMGLTIYPRYEDLLFLSFKDSVVSEMMLIDDVWIIPHSSENFKVLSDNQFEVQPGIYEITLSGLIKDTDDSHGGEFYLVTSSGSAIKDTTFEVPMGYGKQMNFSQTIIFRFEEATILSVLTNITGDTDTSNVIITIVNLLIKKIHT